MGWEKMTGKTEESTKEIPIQPASNPFKTLKTLNTKRGLKMGIYGLPASGKTHFALTAEPPVYIIDTELGCAPLKNYPEFKDKVINAVEIFEPNEETLERDDVKSFEAIRRAIDWVYKNAESGTIIIDSATDLWKLAQSYCKVMIFKLKPEDRLKYRFDWGTINNLYQQLILKLLAMPLNVIFTARSSEVFDDKGQATGRYAASWQKQTPYMIDVILETKKRVGKEEVWFESQIMKSRFNKDAISKTYRNLDFKKLREELKPKEVKENVRKSK